MLISQNIHSKILCYNKHSSISPKIAPNSIVENFVENKFKKTLDKSIYYHYLGINK